MRIDGSRRTKLIQILLGVGIVIALVAVRGTKAGNKPVHLTTDWSHHHMVFSGPKTLAERVRLLGNPRFVQQGLRRSGAGNGFGFGKTPPWRHPETGSINKDWNMYMGYGGDPTNIVPGSVGADTFPAKFSFDSTSAVCDTTSTNFAPGPGQQPDFVVYNSGLSGANTPIPALNQGTIVSEPATNDTIIFTNDSGHSLTLSASTLNSNTASGATATGTFALNASTTTLAANIAAATNLAGNGSSIGITATSSGNVVTFATTATGFAVDDGYLNVSGTTYNTTIDFTNVTFQDGADAVVSVIAYDNLYSVCSGLFPYQYWAYATGGTVVTSPVISGDGTQVVFVQNSGGQASLVVLKWARAVGTATVAQPIALTTQASAAAYRSCTAPCMYTITLGGAAGTDTFSSPYYDYNNDIIYVGDDNGFLHKFTGVFYTTPAEVLTGGWPATVIPGDPLTSPVLLDGAGGATATSSGVFVGSQDGYLARVDATQGGGSITYSSNIASIGIQDAPVVDSTTNKVYVAVTGDNNGITSPAIFQFAANFAGGTGGTEAIVGQTFSASIPLYDGTFDNNYYSSVSGTGSMYVCATQAGGNQALVQIPITAGVMGTPVVGPTLTTSTVGCSPTTEYFDGTTDRMFMSVTASSVTAAPVNCPASTSGGCILAYDITSSSGWTTSKVSLATAAEVGGTSGIVVDNSAAVLGTGHGFGQVYFTPLGIGFCTSYWQGFGGCATQASQSGLN